MLWAGRSRVPRKWGAVLSTTRELGVVFQQVAVMSLGESRHFLTHTKALYGLVGVLGLGEGQDSALPNFPLPFDRCGLCPASGLETTSHRIVEVGRPRSTQPQRQGGRPGTGW